MASDPETTAALGSIGATLEHINQGMSEFRADMKDARKEGDERGRDLHQRINSLSTDIGEIKASQMSTGSSLNAHLADDERRFSLLWRVVLGAGSGGALVAAGLKMLGGI